ncbi:MAG: CusA/CzcA family heavy metal efflux RND transporter [candidate division Zixibacteria bacterium]|nr:CusA/CzcA family heavy metal efflux RND transporter [candidate division Zixibacteria bacterium]
MLEKIIDYSIKNRFIIILLTAVTIVVGIYCLLNIKLDAIPDLSDVQVIIKTEYPGQAPQIVEDQVTYPLTTAMLSVPYARVVRGYSFFGFSLVYIIFEDGTDIYWARSRVLEYLNFVSERLPRGVTPQLGPDATGVGWIYEYTVEDESGNYDLSDLRSIQDWYLRYALTAVPGVSEVASVGGYVKQYQVEVDPNKLLAYNIPLSKVKMAIQRSNNDVGGRLIEMAEAEFMVRGLGYIKSLEDLRNIPLGTDGSGTPILLRNVAQVKIGPELRRGVTEKDGKGEVVGGVIVMRFGENALKTINLVKKKLEELKPGLPPGVVIKPAYDRSRLIQESINTLKHTLLEEMIVVAIVIAIFLLHFRSSLVAIFTLPTAVLISFIIMYIQGINANIMSLGGIAIAIGAMVDAAIIMVENGHKHLEKYRGQKDYWTIISTSAKEVGPTLFHSLLVITVSFLPVFLLEQQEGRLFKPLAFTKSYAMAGAAFLSLTIVPVLMGYWLRGKIRSEDKNPLSKLLHRLYHPVISFVLKYRWGVLITALVLMAVTIIPILKIGSEFMPPLYEGDLLYMPTTFPGISITKAKELLQQTDKIIASFPEVKTVFGKIGRAETATDPAPLTMIETTIMLKPEKEWRPGMTPEKLVEELDKAIQFPGLTNAWTMPIKTRIDMLATGIKTPVGIKIMGENLDSLTAIGERIEAAIRKVPGTLSAFSERVTGGNYLDYEIKREEAARYGLTVGDIQDVIMSAVGGMNVTYTVEGLERYPVNLRYPRELRDNLTSLQRILIPTPAGAQIPITQVADIKIKKGPPAIKSENARRTAWVYVDIRGVDVGTYVRNARKTVEAEVKLPYGYNLVWSGQYEYMLRVQKRLMLLIPLTILIIFFILYHNTKSVTKTLIVFLAVPFSLVGAFWFMYILGYNTSVAVWVGMIALAGLDAETGVVMLLYLDLAYRQRQESNAMNTTGDLREAIHYGAVRRVRPKLMTVGTTMIGLMPLLWSTGIGSDVSKRIAAPMVGGLVTSFLLELLVYPVIFFLWRGRKLPEGEETKISDNSF